MTRYLETIVMRSRLGENTKGLVEEFNALALPKMYLTTFQYYKREVLCLHVISIANKISELRVPALIMHSVYKIIIHHPTTGVQTVVKDVFGP